MEIFALPTAVIAVVHAYIGPGAGITVIGTAVAFLGAIVLAILGFIWYPIKRLRAKFKDRQSRKQVPHR